MQHWLSLTPAGQRPDLLAGLPGLFRHQNDHKAVLGVMQVLLTPYMDGREGPAARQAAQLAMARVLRQAGATSGCATPVKRAVPQSRVVWCHRHPTTVVGLVVGRFW